METLRGASSVSSVPSTAEIGADSELWTASWVPEERVDTLCWVLRASSGVTSRANSAVPRLTATSDTAASLEELEAYYSSRGLPARVQLPRNPRFSTIAAALDARGYSTEFATLVQISTAPFAQNQVFPAALDHELTCLVTERLSDAWAELYLSSDGRGNMEDDRRQLAILARTPSLYLTVSSGADTVAVARLTVIDDVAALTGMVVTENQRGRGIGRLLLQNVMEQAAVSGCSQVALQVTVANSGAQRLYARAGFHTVDSYEYRVAPQ